MNACLLIPIYNQPDTIRSVVESLIPYEKPCLIVNDGSNEETREVLEQIAAEFPWVSLYHRPARGGKGAALKTGFRCAAALGFSHAIQLDADSQHDATDVPRFLAAMERYPRAHVLGQPIFDASVSKRRLYARQVSRALVWLCTLSFAVRDPLCGYRGVPLLPMLALIDSVPTGDHMEFDPEVAVRMCWEGVPVVTVPTKVVYLPGGLSHFVVCAEYPRLIRLYSRLLVGMVRRAPELLGRRGTAIDPADHAEERGAPRG